MNENYGYIVIPPELHAKYGPKRKGDQVFIVSGWVTSRVDEPFHRNSTYRRPLVPPGSDWELVGLDEVPLHLSYDATRDGETWFTFPNVQEWTVEKWLEADMGFLAIRRRKRQPQPASSWISVKERLPQPDEYPCWVTDGKEIDESYAAYKEDCRYGKRGTPIAADQSYEFDKAITHFCPKPKQEPPPLPRGESEEEEESKRAFIAWYNKKVEEGPTPLPSDAWEASRKHYAALQQKATK